MKSPLSIHLGTSRYRVPSGEVTWNTLVREGQPYVHIGNVDAMPPFFMSIVGDSDPWLFVGSHGAFTAGRVDPDGALFPYQTVDRILAHPDSSGVRSIFLVGRDDGTWALWEPWQAHGRVYNIRRDLYKHVAGTSVRFEETNEDLQLRFSWELTTCEAYGLVRDCHLERLGGEATEIRYLDGWHQLIPPGVTVGTFNDLSYLATAYMRHDKVPDVPMGIYTLNALISDRAEPAESLRAAVAWSVGHPDPRLLLSDRNVDAFRGGHPIESDLEIRGAVGACLIADQVHLAPGHGHRWLSVADTGLDHPALNRLRAQAADPQRLAEDVRQAVAQNRIRLRRRIAGADGLQCSADSQVGAHHFANVLFNGMRGGTFPHGYQLPAHDFAHFLRSRNRGLFAAHRDWLEQGPKTLHRDELIRRVNDLGDPQLLRLASEYLPLTFSRRHGDPSRPWNHFAIHLRDQQGRPRYAYQGNWRDIFQNWEGLAPSYPGWLPSMINVFLSASTADGYNPFRITREGIDWDVLDPTDPWSQIGYWGDHQIIYLLRLLEAENRHHPGRLAGQLDHRAYAYAEVPYEIAGFDALVADPRNSVAFDRSLHSHLIARAAEQGGDGKLLQSASGEVVLVTLAEKLLVPFLSKLTNFVPDGGIWLNTQRPEWNDANNALAGWGLSMVTVYHLRRYTQFCIDLFAQASGQEVTLSSPVASMIDAVTQALTDRDLDRYQTLEALGRAGETYRAEIYRRTPTSPEPVSIAAVNALLAAALSAIDHTIRNNRRPDGLYHSYNTLHLEAGQATVRHLPLMLEGQVAVLGAGRLAGAETLSLLNALRQSDLYRADQHSYLLYPDREVPTFLARNTLPADALERAPLLAELLRTDDRSLVVRDDQGALHFAADLRNARDVESCLKQLTSEPAFQDAVSRDRSAVLGLWETVFQHQAFTGRSSTFFAFEGLGSIYWHMVAKLLLAVQECHRTADPAVAPALAGAYDDIRRGLGFTKTPDVFGAIPTDPYSHSPRHCGAQQPGMTGQVKEEILTRWGELGVETQSGCLHFAPRLLHPHEFAPTPEIFEYVDVHDHEQVWELPRDSLAFTICQVPVCYHLSEATTLTVHRDDGTCLTSPACELSASDTERVWGRDGSITRIAVGILRRDPLAQPTKDLP